VTSGQARKRMSARRQGVPDIVGRAGSGTPAGVQDNLTQFSGGRPPSALSDHRLPAANPAGWSVRSRTPGWGISVSNTWRPSLNAARASVDCSTEAGPSLAPSTRLDLFHSAVMAKSNEAEAVSPDLKATATASLRERSRLTLATVGGRGNRTDRASAGMRNLPSLFPCAKGR